MHRHQFKPVKVEWEKEPYYLYSKCKCGVIKGEPVSKRMMEKFYLELTRY